MRQGSALSVTGSRPISSGSHSATRIHNYRHIGTASFVDETLFASPSKNPDPEFDPPWGEKPAPRPLLFYTPSPSTTPRLGSARSGASSARSSKRRHIVTHKPSFVDESLFGPLPKAADFPAPWDKEKKVKPLLWCAPSFGNDRTDHGRLSSRNSTRSARSSQFCDSSRISSPINRYSSSTSLANDRHKTRTVHVKKPVWR